MDNFDRFVISFLLLLILMTNGLILMAVVE